jgi:hypothetical protein
LKVTPAVGMYAFACAGGTKTALKAKTESAITARKSFFIKN